MNLKKLFLIIVIIFTLCIAFGITVNANYNGSCGENATWDLDTDTGVLTISGEGYMTDYSSSIKAPCDTFNRLKRLI